MRVSLTAVLLICLEAGAWSDRTVPSLPEVAIPSSYFGLHLERAVPTARFPQPSIWPDRGFSQWRLWDAGVSWPQLEPARGDWHFDLLDRYVTLADTHRVDILLPLALSPSWASARPQERSAYGLGNAAEPRDVADWRLYVRSVATRYRGRIHQYEIWNEPNLPQFFTGDVRAMVTLVAAADSILKEVDVANILVSPAPTTYDGLRWLDAFLEAGGGRYVDVIGYHFYVSPRPPEAMGPLIDSVHALLERHDLNDHPLWNTETGWFIANHESQVGPVGTGSAFRAKILTDNEASAYVARAFVVGRAHELARFYWYAWDDQVMGLTEADGQTEKAPAKAFGTIQEWLVGFQILSCRPDSAGVWVAKLLSAGARKAWLVWRSQGSTTFRIPANWGVNRVRDLQGGSRFVSGPTRHDSISVGEAPVLLDAVL